MKTFLVGRVNSRVGKYNYLHVFTGETDNSNNIIIDKTIIYFDSRNEGIPVVYNNRYNHEEKDLDEWLQLIFKKVFLNKIESIEEWYINI